MTGVAVRRVDPADRASVRAFVDLPFRLNRDHPQWAPLGLVRDAARQLDPRRHPFYAHSEAAFFLAEAGGEVVGRIAAIDNRRFNEYRERRTGFFGLFETVDDRAVSERLFDAVFDWMSGRGLEDVIGPRGLMGLDGSVLVEGFEHPAVVGVPWNADHYDRLVGGAGFAPDGDYLSGWFPNTHQHDPRIYAVADRARDRGGFRVQSFASRRELARWVPRVVPVFLESMAELSSFYPPTQAEIAEVVGAVLMIADPRGIKVVMKDDEVAGFLFSYPDLAPYLRRSGGRLFPTGWLTLLAGRRRQRAYVINGLGLAPRFRRFGANALLYAEMSRTMVEELDVSRTEVVQVAADNAKSLQDMTALGVRWYKRHRHYRRDL